MSMVDDNLFYGIILVAVIARMLPVLGKMLCVLYTMIHETAHAIAAILSSSKILSINLFHDTSGIAKTATSNSIATFIIVIAGYPLAAIFSYLSCYLIYSNQFQLLLTILLAIAAINLLLWVRNQYGILWLLIFISLISYLIYSQDLKLMKVFSTFFATILFVESLVKSFVVFIMSIKSPALSGDAKILNQTTHLPSLFWGIIFLSFSVYMAYLSVVLFI